MLHLMIKRKHNIIPALITVFVYCLPTSANDVQIEIKADVVAILGVNIVKPSFEGARIASINLDYIDVTPKIESFCAGGCTENLQLDIKSELNIELTGVAE